MESGRFARGEEGQDGEGEGMDCGEGADDEGVGIGWGLGGWVVGLGLGRRVSLCDGWEV